MAKTTMYSKALEYVLTQGYSVFPVKNKKPLVDWKVYQEKHATEDEIATWWKTWPDAGIAIVTGTISGITVVDIDIKDNHVTPDVFPDTYTVRTPSGGWHLYYEYHTAVKTSARAFENLPGVDIRNEGGYVVAPPTEGYIIEGGILADFPVHLFHKKDSKKGNGFKLTQGVGIQSGGRNQSIAQTIGSLLRNQPSAVWENDVWPVVLEINKTYKPPLTLDELKRTFESIANREKANAETVYENNVESPVQISPEEMIRMRLRGTKSGFYKDVANAVFALSAHPDWVNAFAYDTFQRQILFNGKPLTDRHIIDAQIWMQRDLDLSNIAQKTVYDAILQRADQNTINSAHEWLKSLEWDGIKRIDTWLHKVYFVEDCEYHTKVGSNWLRALCKRIANPGSKFDHVLVIQGGQGSRKTTSFEVLGQSWHVETIVHADSKDFLMQFAGKAIVEFAEGATLTRSETKTLKALITRNNDKYRAPYGRQDEEHPRQCVFCMTTNDAEYLRDETGERRWWIVEMEDGVKANIDWLRENRDQLFAEAYARREESTWEVPIEEAERRQENSRVVDAIEDQVVYWYTHIPNHVRENGITVKDVVDWLYEQSGSDRKPAVIDKQTEWRVKSILKGVLKLKYTQRRVGKDGDRVRRFFATAKTPNSIYNSDFEERHTF